MTVNQFNSLTIDEKKLMVEEKGKEFDSEITYEGYMDFFRLEDFFVKKEYKHVDLVQVEAFADMPAQ